MNWSYGITTVPQRRLLLQNTVKFLSRAGFPNPIVFVDDYCGPAVDWDTILSVKMVNRSCNLGLVPNFLLGLIELYARNPGAKFFAMFQDDIELSQGTRTYIEKTVPKGFESGTVYLNLYTVPHNLDYAIGQSYSDEKKKGWYPAPQRGKGATGLVFSRKTVLELITDRGIYNQLKDQTPISKKKLDGKIWYSLCDRKDALGPLKEYVHNPGFIQHHGRQSTLGNTWKEQSGCYMGSNFNFESLLEDPEYVSKQV